MPIKLYGDEVLRRVSKAVDNIDAELVNLVISTTHTMRAGKGLGLAANQVGVEKRFFAIDLSYFDVVKEPVAIINPEIADISGSVVGEEGCLSFPGLYLEIERPAKAVVTGLDIHGRELTLEGEGLIARVLLHEIDHLNGKLYIDYLSKLNRELLKGKLKKIKAGERV